MGSNHRVTARLQPLTKPIVCGSTVTLVRMIGLWLVTCSRMLSYETKVPSEAETIERTALCVSIVFVLVKSQPT